MAPESRLYWGLPCGKRLTTSIPADRSQRTLLACRKREKHRGKRGSKTATDIRDMNFCFVGHSQDARASLSKPLIEDVFVSGGGRHDVTPLFYLLMAGMVCRHH